MRDPTNESDEGKMNIYIKSNAVIDTLIPCIDEMQECRENVPRGTYIYEDSPYKPYTDRAHRAEQTFMLASDLLNASPAALYATALTARRWYGKTAWQKCLPESEAEKLFTYMMGQYPQGGY